MKVMMYHMMPKVLWRQHEALVHRAKAEEPLTPSARAREGDLAASETAMRVEKKKARQLKAVVVRKNRVK